MDLNKTYNNRKLEARRKQILEKQQAVAELRRRKDRRVDARAQILAAFDDGRDVGPLSAHVLRNLGTRKRPLARAARDAMRRLLLCVDAETYLLNENRWAQAVVRLARRHGEWLRPPEAWKARSHNAARQFASLARHLFARYDVPAFMDAAWALDAGRGAVVGGGDGSNLAAQEWFLHIGRGENIRKASGLPVALTKMMAHHFALAPDNCTIVQALRWGQLRGMGATQRVAQAVLGSRLGEEFAGAEREPFWATVFHFLAQHPMTDPHQVGPIIDYLHHQKYVPVGPVNVGGTFVEQGPPQPGLSMKGRTPESLVNQVEAWHRILRRVRDVRHMTWPPCGVAGYDRIEGEPGNQRRFFITELLGTAELRAEGAAMHHCVGTYGGSCQSGRTAIFSLKADVGAGPERRATIEVNVRTRQITQARAKRNEPIPPVDLRVMNAWATTAQLGISPYALDRRW
jgi:hypothetical protein